MPFIYSINSNYDIVKKINITYENPIEIGFNILNDKIDIGLCPISILNNLKDYKIINQYCISAYKYVKSVIVVSNKSLASLQSINLDNNSMTSNILLKILAKFYWKNKTIKFYYNNLYADGKLLIGDNALLIPLKKYKYCVDLCNEWYKFTKLPFVFAVWVGKKNIDKLFIHQLNNTLDYGIKNRIKIITLYNDKYVDYIINNIQYRMNFSKFNAINLFMKYKKLL